MKIVTTTASLEGFGDPASNRARIEDACQVLDNAAAAGACLAVLPAGFLHVPDGRQQRAGAEILARAEKLGIGVVFGIDASAAKRSKRPSKRDETNREWPFFIIARGTTGVRRFWRQRSTTRENGAALRGEQERRMIDVDRDLMDVLTCGEVFSSVLRAACETWGTRRIVVPFHTAAGSRFSSALAWAERNGMRCVRAVHANAAKLAARSVTHLGDTEGMTAWIAEV